MVHAHGGVMMVQQGARVAASRMVATETLWRCTAGWYQDGGEVVSGLVAMYREVHGNVVTSWSCVWYCGVT